MPRYRFSWSNIPESLLGRLASALKLDDSDDAPRRLARIYGVRPKEDFIGAAWPVLVEHWLSVDSVALTEITATLRERGLGDSSIEDNLEYLRKCRNTINLRRVVLPVFINLGEVSAHQRDFDLRVGTDISAGEVGLPKKGGARDSRAHVPDTAEDETDLPKKGGAGDDSARPPSADESRDTDTGLPKKGQAKSEHGGIARTDIDEDVENPVERFRHWLLETVRDFTDNEALEPDEDGDIPVDFGSSRTYMSPRNNPLSVEIYSILVDDVALSPDLMTAINSTNCSTVFAKVSYREDSKQLILNHQLLANGVNPEILRLHVGILVRMADSLDSEFAERFGGRLHGLDVHDDEQAI